MPPNDWPDRDLDATERPDRPIPSGRVSAPAALGVAAGLTAAGIAIAGATGGRRALSVAGPLAAAVWAYDLKAKNTNAGPLAMAACRALDVLLGASTGVRGLADRSHPDAVRIERTARQLLGDARFDEATLEGGRADWSELVTVALAG
ncbi:hypothetical protein GCM10009558_112280 [Virgisporangium aurantiacum]